jgi:hypothetical protein
MQSSRASKIWCRPGVNKGQPKPTTIFFEYLCYRCPSRKGNDRSCTQQPCCTARALHRRSGTLHSQYSPQCLQYRQACRSVPNTLRIASPFLVKLPNMMSIRWKDGKKDAEARVEVDLEGKERSSIPHPYGGRPIGGAYKLWNDEFKTSPEYPVLVAGKSGQEILTILRSCGQTMCSSNTRFPKCL